MADQNSLVEAFSVQVGGTNVAINNLKELRAQQKALRSEFIAGNQDAAKSLALLNDKLEDLNEVTNTVKGSGVERLTSSLGLLWQGFASADFDKIKAGFRGIGAAMSAIPIFLAIEGIKLLIDNFDKLVDFISSSTNEVTELTKALEDNKKTIEERNLLYDRETILLQASGAKQSEVLESQKRAGEARLLQLKEEEKQLYAILAATQERGDSEDEINAKIKANDIEYTKTLTNTAKLVFDTENAKAKEAKEASDKIKEDRKKRNSDLLKIIVDGFAEEQAVEDAQAKALADKEAQYQADKLAGLKLIADQEKALRDQNVRESQEAANKLIAQDKFVQDTKRKLAQGAFSTLQMASATYFANQLAAARGNAAAETEIRKKQFNVEKAFRIANVVIDAAGGIMKTVGTLGLPAATPFIIGIGALAAAQTAIIAAAKFDAGTSASGSGSSSGGGGIDAGISQPPSAPQIATQGPGNTTIINVPGSERNYVVETDITTNQRRVFTLESQSKY